MFPEYVYPGDKSEPCVLCGKIGISPSLANHTGQTKDATDETMIKDSGTATKTTEKKSVEDTEESEENLLECNMKGCDQKFKMGGCLVNHQRTHLGINLMLICHSILYFNRSV